MAAIAINCAGTVTSLIPVRRGQWEIQVFVVLSSRKKETRKFPVEYYPTSVYIIPKTRNQRHCLRYLYFARSIMMMYLYTNILILCNDD